MAGPLYTQRETGAARQVTLPPQSLLSGLLAEDSRFISGGRAAVPREQAQGLRTLFSFLGAQPSPDATRRFLEGRQQHAEAPFTRLPGYGRDARRNLQLFLKKYEIALTDPAAMQHFVSGRSFVIGGIAAKQVAEEDISKLRRMGIFVTAPESGECHIRNRAGQLAQDLANAGISVSVNPNLTLSVVNNAYFPPLMPQETREALQKGLQSAQALMKAGKQAEAFYIHNLFLNVVSAYQQLDAVAALRKSAASADVNLRRGDFANLVSSRQVGAEGFRRVFGASPDDFVRLGTLGRFAQYKLAAAEQALRKSAETHLGCLSALSKPAPSAKERDSAMKAWREQSMADAVPPRLVGEAQAVLSICGMINANRKAQAAWFMELKGRLDAVKGKEARRVLGESAKAAEAEARKRFTAIEAELRRMLFFGLAAVPAAMSGNAQASDYCAAQFRAMQARNAESRKAIGAAGAEFLSLAARARKFESDLGEVVKELGVIRERSKSLTEFERNSLNTMRNSLFVALQKEYKMEFSRPMGEDDWDVLGTALKARLLDSYDPRTIFVQNGDQVSYNRDAAAGKLFLLASNHIDGMSDVTWRAAKNEETLRDMAVNTLRKLHGKLVAGLPELEKRYSRGGTQHLRSPVDALSGLADAVESGKVSVDEAGKRYLRIMDGYGRNLFLAAVDDAKSRLAELKPLLKKQEGPGQPAMSEAERNLVSILFRNFFLAERATRPSAFEAATPRLELAEEAEKMLNGAKYRPGSFMDLYAARVGSRFTGDKAQMVFFLADTIGVAHTLAWQGRFLASHVKATKGYLGTGRIDNVKLAQTMAAFGTKPQDAAALLRDSAEAYRYLETMIPPGKKADLAKLLREAKEVQAQPARTDKELRRKLSDAAPIYFKFADKLNDALEDTGFEEFLKGKTTGQRAGWRTLRFMERHLDSIMAGAFVAGVVLGAVTSYGTASGAGGVAARATVGAGARKLLQRYGWSAVRSRIQQRLATVTARELARSGMMGISLAGKGVMAASAVPMYVGARDYYYGGPEGKAEAKAMFEQGLGNAFWGLMSSYGPLGSARHAAPALRGLSFASDIFLAGATGMKLHMVYDRASQGDKIIARMEQEGAKPEDLQKAREAFYPGKVDKVVMGMDVLFVGIGLSRLGAGTFGLVKSIRGPVAAYRPAVRMNLLRKEMALAGKQKAAAALEKAQKVHAGDVVMLGMLQMEPLLQQALIPAGMKKEWEAEMALTRKGLPSPGLMQVDYKRMGLIPEEATVPEGMTLLEAYVKMSTPKRTRIDIKE